MLGRIFTAKPDLDERPRSWCFTTCREMPLVFRSRTLCSVRNLLGHGYDVLRPLEHDNWKAPYAEDRAAFVRAFYNYACANSNGRPQLWSEWLRSGER